MVVNCINFKEKLRFLTKGVFIMNINTLRKEHNLINTFCELAQIPSPSLKEELVADKIIEILRELGVSAKKDDYGNVIAKLAATQGYENTPALLLSAHMDVVGGSEPVNIRLSDCGKYIETDKTRTLGADDKAGAAAILSTIEDIVKENINHGPIEMTFTRDEELGMTGIRNLDTSILEAEYAIIIDGENIGEIETSGAGFTNAYIEVKTFLGGHSGMQIHDTRRVSAIKILSELVNSIPQGVYKKDESGTITSINAGSILGGGAGVYLSEKFKHGLEETEKNEFSEDNILGTICANAPVNVISTQACVSYSIRSSEPDNEEMLINEIKEHISRLNDKYRDLAEINLKTDKHLEPFVKQEDDTLVKIIEKAGKNIGISTKSKSFHAGAETHVFANEKENSYGRKFKPVIISAANLENIHSKNETLEWKSFLTGKNWLKEIIMEFFKNYNL